MNDTATAGIYTDGHTLSLHDALPDCTAHGWHAASGAHPGDGRGQPEGWGRQDHHHGRPGRRSGPARATSPGHRPRPPGQRVHRSRRRPRSEENKSELQSLMTISYAVFFLQKKNNKFTPTPRKS